MAEGKMCKYCLTFKPYDSFGKEKTCSDGHRGRCKDCMKPIKHLHYINNKEKYHQAYQEFMLVNPDYQKEYYLRTKYHKGKSFFP